MILQVPFSVDVSDESLLLAKMIVAALHKIRKDNLRDSNRSLFAFTNPLSLHAKTIFCTVQT